MESNGRICPLLKEPQLYQPDTVDLINNLKERNYWLSCLENMVKKFIDKANSLNPDYPKAREQAEACFNKFHNLVVEAKDNPSVLTPLTIRTLLEFNEDNLREHHFKDAWHLQKESESLGALKQFRDRIESIDLIDNFGARWIEIVTGVLAGNVFDWGSNVVSNILENSTNFGLKQAMQKIEKRPWFIDDLDRWIEKIEGAPYQKVVIFVDNAGVDFILGIMPLVRELLKQKTRVILTGNTAPALNDVTYRELKLYCDKISADCPIITQSLQTDYLQIIENGQKGPCLDLTNLSNELCDVMSSADLIILEGMGRAVHTNLYANFKVDSIKVAVLKNNWLAKSLGAHEFSVIFKYESAT